MSDFKDRLEVEFSELHEKTKALSTFVNSNAINTVEESQRHLLYIQLRLMEGYRQCLDSRLQLLK